MRAIRISAHLFLWSCGAWFVSGDHVSESNPSSVTCYQCGQPEIDPESDYPNSYCDATVPNNNCNQETNKMYNLTCDIMDKMDPSPYWTRWKGYWWSFLRGHPWSKVAWIWYCDMVKKPKLRSPAYCRQENAISCLIFTQPMDVTFSGPVVNNSRNKINQTWSPNFSPTLNWAWNKCERDKHYPRKSGE